HRDATGDVGDLDAVEQIGRPAGWYQLKDGILGDCARSMLSWPADKDALHGVARGLVRRARAPADRRPVELPAEPPLRVAPGRVHGGFHAARKALARLVGRNEQTFAMSRACVMELHLAGVGGIVRQCVLDRTARLDRFEPS